MDSSQKQLPAILDTQHALVQAPTTAADAQPTSSSSLVQNGSINGIPVWAYGVMGMLAGLIVLSVFGKVQADFPEQPQPLVCFGCDVPSALVPEDQEHCMVCTLMSAH